MMNLFTPEKRIFTRARLLPPSKIYGTRLNRTLMAEGCVIEADSIFRSVIGIRSHVGKNTVINDSIIMGTDRYLPLEETMEQQPNMPVPGVGSDCHIECAIIDTNARIGNNVRITGGGHLEDTENENYSITDGIIVVKKNGILEDGATI